VVSPLGPDGAIQNLRVFEHASIPATVTNWFIPNFDPKQRSPREQSAQTFLDLLSLPTMRTDDISFDVS
jgi:hypothetical protein